MSRQIVDLQSIKSGQSTTQQQFSLDLDLDDPLARSSRAPRLFRSSHTDLSSTKHIMNDGVEGDRVIALGLAQEFKAFSLRERQDELLAREVARRERRGEDAAGLEAVDGGRTELERIKAEMARSPTVETVGLMLRRERRATTR